MLAVVVPSVDVSIGIDAAFRKGGMGVAFVDWKGKKMYGYIFENLIDTLDFFAHINLASLQKYMPYSQLTNVPSVAILLENSFMSNAKYRNTSNARSVEHKAFAEGLAVGRNQAVSHILSELLGRVQAANPSIIKIDVSPEQKGKKLNEAEFGLYLRSDKMQLYRFTRGELKSVESEKNQDIRDAGKLALCFNQFYIKSKLQKNDR